jgi:hypothetical protein
MMNEEPNGGAMAARVADAFAEEDAKRRDYLDWMVKRGGTCRGCGATVADAQLQEHPGVCGTCHRRKHIKPLELPAPPDATPKPREETTMRARNCCGSKGPRHMANCAEDAKAKAAKPALPPKPPRALKVERPRKVVQRITRAVDLEALDLSDLIELRDDVGTELRRRKAKVDEALRAKVATLEAEARAAKTEADAIREALGEAA